MRKTSLLIAALLMAALLSLAGCAKGGGKGDCSRLWWLPDDARTNCRQ